MARVQEQEQRSRSQQQTSKRGRRERIQGHRDGGGEGRGVLGSSLQAKQTRGHRQGAGCVRCSFTATPRRGGLSRRTGGSSPARAPCRGSWPSRTWRGGRSTSRRALWAPTQTAPTGESWPSSERVRGRGSERHKGASAERSHGRGDKSNRNKGSSKLRHCFFYLKPKVLERNYLPAVHGRGEERRLFLAAALEGAGCRQLCITKTRKMAV
jgi:hypothetical protein